jgi:hypothetical protein
MHRSGAIAFDDLLGQIVKGTNWQNKIERSDLVANDPLQVKLEREFRKRGYVYLRKRQTKGEVRRLYRVKRRHIIKKEVLAQAVAATVTDPAVVREGKEKLFDPSIYHMVFPNADPDFYLPRYVLLREIGYVTKGTPSWGYMKWLGMAFAWKHLEPLVRGKRNARDFVDLSDDPYGPLAVELNRALLPLFTQLECFYNANKRIDGRMVDVSAFFKGRRGLPKEFAKFWRRRTNISAGKFKRRMARVQGAIESHEA